MENCGDKKIITLKRNTKTDRNNYAYSPAPFAGKNGTSKELHAFIALLIA
jgi:hypothetical protein